MDLKTRIRGLTIRGLLLIAALAALTIFINLSWFDEPLRPDLVSLRIPQLVSMEDNSYPLIYGFAAADDRDPRDAGQTIVQKLDDRYQRGERITLSPEEMDEILGGSNLDAAWRAEFEDLACNSRIALDCAGRLIAEVGRANSNRPRLETLLNRYRDILRQPRFEENQEFDAYTPIPDYGLLMAVARMRLAMSYQRDPTGAFLANVAGDFDFWRKMLRDGQSLIAKMVALAGLRNDLEFVSTLLRLRSLESGDTQYIRGFVRPLTPEEQDIGEAFVAELRFVLLSSKPLVVILGDPSWLTRLTLQERATVNEYYLAMVMPLRLRASLSAGAFYRQRGYEPLDYEVRAFPPPLYNLGGKLVLQRMAAQYSMQDYITRVHDLGGRLLLVLLQTEIEQDPRRSVESIVRSSSYRNPYTGDPFEYDAETQTIGFDCLSKNPNDVCSVAVGTTGRR